MDRYALTCSLLTLLMLCSCASSTSIGVAFDPATNASSYESDRIVMGYRDMSGGLASNQRVMWRAMASCTGKDCTPDEVTLVFYNDTSRDLNLDYRRIQILVDDVHHEWEDQSRITERPEYRVPPGEFLRVSLAGSAFADLSRAQKVDVLMGETGTGVFRVSFDRRAKFRTFAEALGLAE